MSHEADSKILLISVRQASVVAHRTVTLEDDRPAIVTSSFKIFLTQTFPLCGATDDVSAIQWS